MLSEETANAVHNYGTGDDVIRLAFDVLQQRLFNPCSVMDNPDTVKNYLVLKLAQLKHEVFGLIFLNTQNQVIEEEIIFRGTLNHTSVYPREIIRNALSHNANSVILYHNHPSGKTDPSASDIKMTKTLGDVLKLIDVQILDHIIVAGTKTISFKEAGLMPSFETS